MPPDRHFHAFLQRSALAGLAMVLGLGLIAPSQTIAVKPLSWTHRTAEDHKKAEYENIAVDDDGTITLSHTLQTTLAEYDGVEFIYDLCVGQDGSIYAATGPGGLVLRIVADQAETFYTSTENHLFSIAAERDGSLLIGSGGEQGILQRIDQNGLAQTLYKDEEVHYIWSIQVAGDGRIFLATGPSGKIIVIEGDGVARPYLETKQKNIMALLLGGDGTLYAGTDGEGLIYRMDRTGKPFLLYDAPENEITALALDDGGRLFAAAMIASDDGPSARPSRSARPRPTSKNGKEEKESSDEDTPAQPADEDEDSKDEEPAPAKSAGEVVRAAMRAQLRRAMSAASDGASGDGHPIYAIEPDGFVSTLLHKDTPILSLGWRDDALYAATASPGAIHRVDTILRTSSLLAQLASNQIVRLINAPQGLLAITANSAGICRLSDDFAAEGKLTSSVLDASHVARWGNLRVEGANPPNTAVQITTRSGNVEDAEDELWSDWSNSVEVFDAYAPINSPPARFLQYRLTLTSTDAVHTPAVRQLRLAYQVPNHAPVLGEVETEYALSPIAEKMLRSGELSKDPAPPILPKDVVKIKWHANDPNSDTLQYKIEFRGIDESDWVMLAEELTETEYAWDGRTVAEGHYLIRISADDSASNTGAETLDTQRLSNTIKLDNTPPVISAFSATVQGDGKVQLSARCQDRLSPIMAAEYSVDSQREWQRIEAIDGIFDSMDEQIESLIRDLEPGSHRIALRVRDERDHVAYDSLSVVVQE